MVSILGKNRTKSLFVSKFETEYFRIVFRVSQSPTLRPLRLVQRIRALGQMQLARIDWIFNYGNEIMRLIHVLLLLLLTPFPNTCRSYVKEKRAQKLWAIEFNDFLKDGQPKIFVTLGGAQFSIYECPDKGNIQLVYSFIDPDVSVLRLSFVWFFDDWFCCCCCVEKRRFLVMLLVNEFEDASFDSHYGRWTWCHSTDRTRTAANRWQAWCTAFHWAWWRCESIKNCTTSTVSVGIGQFGSFGSLVEYRDNGLHRLISRWKWASRRYCYHWFQSRCNEIGIGRYGSHAGHLGFNRAECGQCHQK